MNKLLLAVGIGAAGIFFGHELAQSKKGLLASPSDKEKIKPEKPEKKKVEKKPVKKVEKPEVKTVDEVEE